MIQFDERAIFSKGLVKNHQLAVYLGYLAVKFQGCFIGLLRGGGSKGRGFPNIP